MAKKPNIRDLSLPELEAQMLEWGEKKFRARQIHQWLWQKGAGSFAEMSNLGKGLRDQLSAAFDIAKAQVEDTQRSSDGTIKYAFRLQGGQLVEGVLIPTAKRVTACVSSQAGCSLDCKFCATGFLKLQHNLHHYEIFDQVQILRAQAEVEFGRPLSNIVYMGMGEPLLNYRNVLRSVEMITSPEGLGMSPQRITVSTSGIAKMIRRLADDGVKFEFALSLHAADDATRSRIMPINDSNDLATLREALTYFYEKTRTRVTYEYCIFKDVNDSLAHARDLAAFSRLIPSKVNVIEYNAVPEAGFENTTRARMDAFIQYLEKEGVIVNVRRSRGKDVDGGCGQLALKNWEPDMLKAPAS
ncbi:MAG: 23S rRNA (adenine(2503)-C(2))-methyltransferase RlmN [Bacteroidetes bacterium]|nr:MAG: 23S rRNA (adenine(2503)-C(2))-methyltransferase RlmN [Bacteroidota bacterium]